MSCQVATPAWYPRTAFSIEKAQGQGGRPPGGGSAAAVCRARAWKTLHGCRPRGVAGSSGGGPGGGRAGRGDSRPQSVLCSSLPPELEPMDWRQLRSSVRQSRGSSSGWGPRAGASMGPPYGAGPTGAPRQVAAYFETQFPICATGKIMSVLFTSRAVGLGKRAASLTLWKGEAGVVSTPTAFRSLSGPFQARPVIASPKVSSDPDSMPGLLAPALAPASRTQF